jgi:hypothetical protein
VIKYPIYIISKGRFERPLTANFLLKEKIPFTVAVEPQEYEAYCAALGSKYVAKLPFSNLGQGSTPARNWCWENSIQRGYNKHFLFDDNIYAFMRFNHGKRLRCEAVPALKALEKFSDHYINLGVAGYNYSYFAVQPLKQPFFLNHHVYSGLLINNKIPFRWRLKYNEDVDLCLQTLHSKYWCTVALNVYLIQKVSTVSKMKGGNQTELYKNNDSDKKKLKTKSLEMIWPQYVKSKYRFGRPHHQVSWGKFFKQPLLRAVTQDNYRSKNA